MRPRILSVEHADRCSGSVTETGTYEGLAVNATYQINKRRNSSSGGCDTGIGFGLVLALGALAVFKRARHKA